MARTTRQVSSGPSTTATSAGTPAHEGHQIVVEALSDVFGVVPGEQVGVEGPQLDGHKAQALPLETAQDLAHQTPLDCVRLAYDQSAIHARRWLQGPTGAHASQLRSAYKRSGEGGLGPRRSL